jgi:hypothetical protein
MLSCIGEIGNDSNEPLRTHLASSSEHEEQLDQMAILGWASGLNYHHISLRLLSKPKIALSVGKGFELDG